MEALFLAVCKLTPEEQLLDELQESLTQYKLTHSEEARNKLMMYTMMISTRFGTEKKDLATTITEFERNKKIHETFAERKQ